MCNILQLSHAARHVAVWGSVGADALRTYSTVLPALGFWLISDLAPRVSASGFGIRYDTIREERLI